MAGHSKWKTTKHAKAAADKKAKESQAAAEKAMLGPLVAAMRIKDKLESYGNVDKVLADFLATLPADDPARKSDAKHIFHGLKEKVLRIEALEHEQGELLASMAAFKGSAMQEAAHRAAEIGQELETVYVRWEELEARRG